MRVSPCSVVVVPLLLYVSLCVFMLRRVPLRIRVSPETRQHLHLLRTLRRLNIGGWLRALIDEALEEQKTTDGQEAEKDKPGACSQADSSDRQHGQLAIPLDGPGGRVSRVERSQELGPPTSRMVQCIPVQLEGLNKGIEAE